MEKVVGIELTWDHYDALCAAIPADETDAELLEELKTYLEELLEG